MHRDLQEPLAKALSCDFHLGVHPDTHHIRWMHPTILSLAATAGMKKVRTFQQYSYYCCSAVPFVFSVVISVVTNCKNSEVTHSRATLAMALPFKRARRHHTHLVVRLNGIRPPTSQRPCCSWLLAECHWLRAPVLEQPCYFGLPS